MSFNGLGPQALPFFKALAFHQTKDWFEANRTIYEREVKAPLGDLIDDVMAGLTKRKIPLKGDRKGSIFRINRDVRFSNDKSPYKTHAGVALTRTGVKSEPGVLYFHLSPEGCFFAAGFHMPDAQALAKLRGAAARAPKAYKTMIGSLAKTGLAIDSENALTRAPRGFDGVEDAAIAAAVRLKSFVTDRPVTEAAIACPALVEDFLAFAADALPLLRWGWDALADTR